MDSAFADLAGMSDRIVRAAKKGFAEKTGMRGRVTAIDPRTGKTLLKVSNLVTTVGKQQAAKLWVDDGSPAAMKYLAIGTGTTDPVVGDTTLEGEISTGGGERGLATCSVTGAVAKAELTHNFTGTFAVTKIGWFDAASNGNMGAETEFGAWNVVSGDQVKWIYEMTFG